VASKGDTSCAGSPTTVPDCKWNSHTTLVLARDLADYLTLRCHFCAPGESFVPFHSVPRVRWRGGANVTTVQDSCWNSHTVNQMRCEECRWRAGTAVPAMILGIRSRNFNRSCWQTDQPEFAQEFRNSVRGANASSPT
jgi:hypothetical protein